MLYGGSAKNPQIPIFHILRYVCEFLKIGDNLWIRTEKIIKSSSSSNNPASLLAGLQTPHIMWNIGYCAFFTQAPSFYG